MSTDMATLNDHDVGKIVLVLGITDSWAFAAATVLYGLKEVISTEKYDVIILQYDLSSQNRLLLKREFNCNFRSFEFQLPREESFQRVSRMAFSRFECFDLLDHYETVIWIDADALILKSPLEMLSFCKNGIAMYKHSGVPIKVSFKNDIEGYDMQEECYNDGVMCINNKISRHEEMRTWCYKKTLEYIEDIQSDQAIINLMLQEFDIEVSPLPEMFNCPPKNESPETVIIHPWGSDKFWSNLYHPLWNRRLRKWIAAGGDIGVKQFRANSAKRILRTLLYGLGIRNV